MADSNPAAFESRIVARTTEGVRLRPMFYVGLTSMVVACILFFVIDQMTDNWSGIPFLLGMVAAQFLLFFINLRRHLRAAHQGEVIASKTKYTLSDRLLYLAAFATILGCCILNHHQRQGELARRDVIDEIVQIALGPGGIVERDHRGRVWLTVEDPTFDDQRLSDIAGLLEEDNQRLGVSRFMLKQTAAAQAWPGITKASLPTLLAWKSLSLLVLYGDAIGEEGALRLATLPELRDFDLNVDGFRPETIETLERKSRQLRFRREMEAAHTPLPPEVAEPPLPPILG